MTDSPIIRINSDDARRISRMGGIRLRLANRIVAERDKSGYFKCSGDLRRVKGVDGKLVALLERRVDWSVPGEFAATTLVQQIGVWVVWPPIAVVTFMGAVSLYISARPYVLENLHSSVPGIRIFGLGLFVSYVYVFICLSLMLILNFAALSATREDKRRELARHARRYFRLWIMAILGMGASNLGLYRYRWGGFISGLRSNPEHVVGLTAGIILTTFMSVLIVEVSFPNRLSRKSLATW